MIPFGKVGGYIVVIAGALIILNAAGVHPFAFLKSAAAKPATTA